jgi:hypothetical protein
MVARDRHPSNAGRRSRSERFRLDAGRPVGQISLRLGGDAEKGDLPPQKGAKESFEKA